MFLNRILLGIILCWLKNVIMCVLCRLIVLIVLNIFFVLIMLLIWKGFFIFIVIFVMKFFVMFWNVKLMVRLIILVFVNNDVIVLCRLIKFSVMNIFVVVIVIWIIEVSKLIICWELNVFWRMCWLSLLIIFVIMLNVIVIIMVIVRLGKCLMLVFI